MAANATAGAAASGIHRMHRPGMGIDRRRRVKTQKAAAVALLADAVVDGIACEHGTLMHVVAGAARGGILCHVAAQKEFLDRAFMARSA